MNRTLSEEYKTWDEVIRDQIGQDCKLLHVSRRSSDVRVYESPKNVVKVRRLTPASCRRRVGTYADEAVLLRRLAGLPMTPKLLRYWRAGEWEFAAQTKLPAILVRDPTLVPENERLVDFINIARAVYRMNCAGVSHGDLHTDNVNINIQGGISCFDFDQAIAGNPLHCLLRDFLGFQIEGYGAKVSLWRRAKHVSYVRHLVRLFTWFGWLLFAPLRLFLKSPSVEQVEPMEIASVNGDSLLLKIAEAWKIAERADASSPGIKIAYYSIDINGVNFSGERPWVFRWNMIQGNVVFSGKRLLEIGCNMGLLSIHARLAGAVKCIGIDIDIEIIRAAGKLASAFEMTEISFSQQNLDDKALWEAKYCDADIVSMLSVMHWVNDKERVWRFLGRFTEVIYEGHEPLLEAKQAFLNLGFSEINVIGHSERGRAVIHASKLKTS